MSHINNNDGNDDNENKNDNNSQKKKSSNNTVKTECKLFSVFVSSEGLRVVITYYKNFYIGQKTEDRQEMYTEVSFLL
jgi:hypothetical protein